MTPTEREAIYKMALEQLKAERVQKRLELLRAA